MKYLMHCVLAGGLIAVFAAMPAVRAEDQSPSMKYSKHREMTGEKWKEKLGLSDDQVAKLKSAMKARREAVEPLRKQLKEDMEKLGGQIKLKNSDSEIQATLDRMESTHKAMQAEREKFISSLKSFLTPTQRAKMLLSMTRIMHRGGWGHGSYSQGAPEAE